MRMMKRKDSLVRFCSSYVSTGIHDRGRKVILLFDKVCLNPRWAYTRPVTVQKRAARPMHRLMIALEGTTEACISRCLESLSTYLYCVHMPVAAEGMCLPYDLMLLESPTGYLEELKAKNGNQP